MWIKGIHIKALSDNADISGIAIFPFIITKKKVTERLLNHERIHLAQQVELFILAFYPLYLMHYLIGLWIYRDHDLAYHSIPFETEAYSNDHNPDYLKTRKSFAWHL